METIRVYEVQCAYARGNGNVFKFQITQKQHSRKQWTRSWNTKQAKIIENIKNACTYTTTTISFQCSFFYLCLLAMISFRVCMCAVWMSSFVTSRHITHMYSVHWNVYSLFLLHVVFTLSSFIVSLLRVSRRNVYLWFTLSIYSLTTAIQLKNKWSNEKKSCIYFYYSLLLLYALHYKSEFCGSIESECVNRACAQISNVVSASQKNNNNKSTYKP